MSEDIELVVGRIGKPHGLRGEVTVDVRTDEPTRRFGPGVRLHATPQAGASSRHSTLTVAGSRWHQQILLLRFEEVADRNHAEALRGTVLRARVSVEEVPEDPEEYYDHQLIGLRAEDLDGSALGEVYAVVHGAAQDLLNIRTLDGRLALVPFVAALVPEVDLEASRIVIADRPGLVAPFADDQSTDESS